ncbi:MAG: DUF192 domain-containing protein [Bacteroidota bacterium]
MAQQKKQYKSNNNRNRNNRNHDNRNRPNQQHKGNRDHRKDNRNNPPQNTPPEKTAPKPQAQSKTESSNDLLIFIVFLIALAVFSLVNKFYLTDTPKNSLYGTTTKFMKEGKLQFLDARTGKAIVGIEIEVAKSNYEIEKGLMNRHSLPANGGMLFVFDDEYYRTFWMKNTYIGLDIIFVNADKEIIRIRKNAEPLSELSIPSGGKAQYVVEVLAGFVDAHQLHVGDHIDFLY